MPKPRKRGQKQDPGAIRLSDVARRVGCSTSTVSRALTMPAVVNAEVRTRINAAIAELGYLRNNAAGALRTRRTRTIGAVIPTLDHAIYARLVETMQNAAGENGYSLLVTTSNFEVEREWRQARLLVERGAEGLVLVGHTHAAELTALLASKDIPYVNTYTYRPKSGQSSVGFDNRAASAQIAKYLYELGHRNFGLIVGFRKNNDRVKDRIDGVLGTLAAYGVEVPESSIVEEPYSIEGGRGGLRRLLETAPKPTAVICGSDVLAFGAIIECEERGIAVPRQLSIAGFDDLDFAAHLRPALTTVRVPAAEMGKRAAEYLMARLDGKPHAAHYPLDTSLILRQSTAPPRATRPTRDAPAARKRQARGAKGKTGESRQRAR
jgi:LacI family transcriptional regulator, galactose operon repressor